MTAVSEDATADLNRRIAELEQRLETALIERDAAIERQTASALVSFRLQSELRATADRQHASAEILRTISSAPGDAGRSLQQIAETSARLFGAPSVSIQLVKNGDWGEAYRFGDSATRVRAAVPLGTIRIGGPNLPGTVVAENRQIHLPDLDNLDPAFAHWPGPPHARAAGTRTMCGTPLRRGDEAIGVLIVYRDRLAPFTAEELTLQQTFADQAVIAIENARLFNETTEALERQTATADILRVIASSPSDVQPVFDAIAGSAKRLLGGFAAAVFRLLDGSVHLAAFTPVSGAADEALKADFPRPVDEFEGFRLAQHGKPFPIPDTEELPHAPIREIARLHGFRSMLYVPLMNGGIPIGILTVTRAEPGAFAPHHVQLLQTFADQAVIAIENARLFNETREALERQTATSDILKVIAGSPSDVQPVFEAIVNSAAKLFEPCSATITTLKDGKLHWNAIAEIVPSFDHAAAEAQYPISFDPDRAPSARAILERRIIAIPDTNAPDTPEYTRKVAAAGGFRNIVFVPLIHESRGIGTIILTHPQPGFRLSDKQLALVQTFADQAVIAIQNSRLFNEVQERTFELTEALEQQTATSEVLSVISSSAGDLAPVFDAMLAKAMQLCSASFGVLNTHDGKLFHTAATYGLPPAYDEYRRRQPLDYGPGTAPARLLQGEPFVEIDDLLESEAYRRGDANRLALVDLGGARCLLAVPLLKDDRVVGNVMIFRQENRPFSKKQVALLQQFAAQAVIAIENTRLLRELRESTEDLTESLQQQTATADVLKVISRSAFDLQTVLDTLIESAVRLGGAARGAIAFKDGDVLRLQSHFGFSEEHVAYWHEHPIEISMDTITGRPALLGRTVHIPDVLAPDPDFKNFAMRAVQRGKIRAFLGIPLLREGSIFGVLAMSREEPLSFTDRQIELVQTFADQAVIAIENVRLFDEVQAKTRDLTEALTYQTGSANILNVIASSPTDVGPVLKAIVESACELCEAYDAVVVLEDGGDLRFSAHHGPIPISFSSRPINREWTAGRAFVDKQAVHVHDLQAAHQEFPEGQKMAARSGYRTIVSVPLLRESDSIGVITLRRTEVHPFSDKQVALLQTFADQAVIAIGNVRLFDEVQARTRELSESLEQQTATSEVLSVISRSAGDLEPVFQSMLQNATRICGAQFGLMNLYDGDSFLTVGFHNVPLAFSATRKQSFRPHPDSGLEQVARTKQFVHIDDLRSTKAYVDGEPATVQLADLAGARTILVVPMLKDNELVGTIGIYRLKVAPFNDKQIALLSSFASQAVIAIENTRLLKELRQRTDDLSRSLDDLRTAQDRLVQTEKLASLGQLTAGIAHEIKNPLNFVNNFAALSAELTDELNDVLKPAVLDETIRAEVDELTSTLKDNLGKVVQHGKRADSIVKNMLLHSREGSGDHRPTDINALVDESLNLAYHGARAEKPHFNVTLQRNFDPEAGVIEVFPQEITRVLLNLVSNGFYAVSKRKADHGDGSFEPVVTATTKGRNDHVEIRIRDNGTGIPADVKEKMFNPFFTTKPAGEGTGLGLSMSHDIIVKQHGGTIDVDTLQGEFTEFTIVLPRTSNLSSKSRG